MTEITESLALETWSTPNCPFTIEYSRRLLDDIRLAVVDAFFSLPRGGAEIGGVLLGKFANGRVTILEYVPLECEHIFGPSFTLSPGDHGRLAELLSGASGQFSDLLPMGWYHSHTRSDIFLSDADLDIHNRYFREPWQVALVLRPSTFQPVQAGFFFREPDGSIHCRASYQEFALDPLPVGQVPRGIPAPAPQPIPRQAEPEGPMITLTAAAVTTPVEPEPAPQAVAEAAAVPAEPTPPPRTILLPPALPPLPRLELVPEAGEASDAPVAGVHAEAAVEHFAGQDTVSAEASRDKEADRNKKDDAPVPAAPSVPAAPPAVEVAAEAEGVKAPAPFVFTPFVPAPRVEPEPAIAATKIVTTEVPAEPQPRIEPAPEIKQASAPEPPREPVVAEPPSFLQMEPVKSRRKLWVVGTAAAALVLAAGGYQQRSTWLPQRASVPTPTPVPLTLPLSAIDQQGQLQIRWDGAAQAVTQARDGILQITEDGATTDLPLDAAHLQGGEFTYARRGEHVDARLTVQERDGTQVRAVTSFLGALPEPVKPVAADPVLRKQNADLASKNADFASKNAGLLSKNADLAKINGELQQRLDELSKQSVKLKADLAARAAVAKQNADLTQQNTELRQQRDDLAKQIAKLKTDLAARVAAPKPSAAQAPGSQAQKDAQLVQQRDDLLIQIAKLKTDVASQTGGNKQIPSPQTAELSKQRYQLVNRVSQLESDLAVAEARADRLARQVEDLRKTQTQRRLQNQSGDPTQ